MCIDAQCSAGRNCGAHLQTETYQTNNGQSTHHRFFLQGAPYHYQMKWFVICAPWGQSEKHQYISEGEIFSYCNESHEQSNYLRALRAVQLVRSHQAPRFEGTRPRRTKGPAPYLAPGPASAKDGPEWNLVWKWLLSKWCSHFLC